MVACEKVYWILTVLSLVLCNLQDDELVFEGGVWISNRICALFGLLGLWLGLLDFQRASEEVSLGF